MRRETKNARRAVNRTGLRLLSAIARRRGYELVKGAPPAVIPETEPSLPPGRLEPFQVGGYDVVPHGLYDLVRHDFYSPVPDLAQLPDDIWERRNRLGGNHGRAGHRHFGFHHRGVA